MKLAKRIAGCFLLALVGVFGYTQAAQSYTPACPEREELCHIIDFDNSSVTSINNFRMPAITDPSWTAPVSPRVPSKMTVTYRVETRGAVDSSLENFASQAAQTFADSRGWSRLGVTFQRVKSGGQFTLILSQASLMTSFSSGCDSTYSCNVGNNVIINNDRWQSATPSWNQNKGSLRDYRHMVVNHETGHWLGHGHSYCSGAGQSAPVMQQQSIDLQGCKFNPWPLTSELYSSRLGI